MKYIIIIHKMVCCCFDQIQISWTEQNISYFFFYNIALVTFRTDLLNKNFSYEA